MRRLLAFVGIVALVTLRLALTSVSADTRASGVTRVIVTVNPNIAVSPTSPLWNLSTVQNGTFSATVTWRVDANVQFIQMCLEASDLYKAGDPTNTDVAPIPLDSNMPAIITAEHANEANGGDNRALWIGAGYGIEGFPTKKTESVTYESSQSGHFSQVVTTEVFYNQDDPEKPQGEYSGRLKLLALIPFNEG